VLTFTDAAAFAALVGPVIDRYPAFSSVLASNLDQTRHDPGAGGHWYLLQDGGEPVAAAMRTPPYPLFVTPAPDPPRAMAALAEAVARVSPALPGVNGPVAVSQAFADQWQRTTGRHPGRTLGERLYEITAPPGLVDVPGQARLATTADLAHAVAWATEFNREALPHQAGIDAEPAVRRRLARGRLLFWEVEGRPVSMAGTSRVITGVSRVGAVYTPKENRRNGFGAAATVAATRQGFDDGAERCILYADLANPTSNGIYRALGYRPVGDGLLITFT